MSLNDDDDYVSAMGGTSVPTAANIASAKTCGSVMFIVMSDVQVIGKSNSKVRKFSGLVFDVPRNSVVAFGDTQISDDGMEASFNVVKRVPRTNAPVPANGKVLKKEIFVGKTTLRFGSIMNMVFAKQHDLRLMHGSVYKADILFVEQSTYGGEQIEYHVDTPRPAFGEFVHFYALSGDMQRNILTAMAVAVHNQRKIVPLVSNDEAGGAQQSSSADDGDARQRVHVADLRPDCQHMMRGADWIMPWMRRCLPIESAMLRTGKEAVLFTDQIFGLDQPCWPTRDATTNKATNLVRCSVEITQRIPKVPAPPSLKLTREQSKLFYIDPFTKAICEILIREDTFRNLFGVLDTRHWYDHSLAVLAMNTPSILRMFLGPKDALHSEPKPGTPFSLTFWSCGSKAQIAGQSTTNCAGLSALPIGVVDAGYETNQKCVVEILTELSKAQKDQRYNTNMLAAQHKQAAPDRSPIPTNPLEEMSSNGSELPIIFNVFECKRDLNDVSLGMFYNFYVIFNRALKRDFPESPATKWYKELVAKDKDAACDVIGKIAVQMASLKQVSAPPDAVELFEHAEGIRDPGQGAICFLLFAVRKDFVTSLHLDVTSNSNQVRLVDDTYRALFPAPVGYSSDAEVNALLNPPTLAAPPPHRDEEMTTASPAIHDEDGELLTPPVVVVAPPIVVSSSSDASSSAHGKKRATDSSTPASKRVRETASHKQAK